MKTRRTKAMQAKIAPKFNSRFRNMRGMGKNTGVKITGARGARVRIPRSADSFKSKTDNT